MAIDDDAESCGSIAEDSLACENPTQDRQKLEVYNKVLARIKESNYEEANMSGFDRQLWHHYNRLPIRYALDLNVDLAEVVLTHKRLLHLAEDPANRPAFDVRIVQVYPVSTAHSIESVHSDSSVKDVQSAYHSYRQGIHPPPTFGSSSILETLALQASRYNDEDRDSDANLCKPMHEITFTTIDRPQLLSQLCSLLTEMGLDILEKHAFSTIDGYSLDVFVVDGWPFETTKELKNALEKEVLKFKVVENENLRQEIERLRTENLYLNGDIARYEKMVRGFRDEIRKSEEVNVRLTADCRRVQGDNDLLINENKVLKNENKILAIKGGIPELILRREESHNSQSTSFGDHPIANHQEMKDLPMLSNIRIPKDESAFKDIVDELIESFQSTTNHAQMVLTEFLEKLEADVNSNVKLSDFSGLEGERKEVGRYSFPLSLIPIVEKIDEVYGDISAGVTMNRMISETVYVMFCAAMKEMDDLQIGEVTEDKMLKWRDVFNDALRLKFNVGFAMEHLKKIARAYFGQKPVLQLQSITEKILRLENELKNYKRRKYEDSKTFLAVSQEFIGVPVSTGLFTYTCKQI